MTYCSWAETEKREKAQTRTSHYLSSWCVWGRREKMWLGALFPQLHPPTCSHTPATSWFGCMPRTQRLAWLDPPPHPTAPAYMLPLMLPDYSASANQYSQALGMGAPLELLLLNVRSFTGIGGGWVFPRLAGFSGMLAQAHSSFTEYLCCCYCCTNLWLKVGLRNNLILISSA